MNEELLSLQEPTDYFSGIGNHCQSAPTNVLIFVRRNKRTLQQEALQNRSHHRLVLALNLETEGRIHVDHLLLPFKPGHASLILPYQFHHFSRLAASRLKWVFCTFEMASHAELEPLRNRVIKVGEKCREAWEALLEDWQGESPELVQAALHYLLTCLKRDEMNARQEFPPEPEDDLLRSINRIMSSWRGRPMIVTDLAEALGSSESRLRSLFREVAGISLGSYLQNYRLNRAMALLRTTDFPISDVATEAGFGSPQSFSRVFKKETGSTPRAYRQKRA